MVIAFVGLRGTPVVSSMVLPSLGRNSCHSRRSLPAAVVSSWACEFSFSPKCSLSPSRVTAAGHTTPQTLHLYQMTMMALVVFNY